MVTDRKMIMCYISMRGASAAKNITRNPRKITSVAENIFYNVSND